MIQKTQKLSLKKSAFVRLIVITVCAVLIFYIIGLTINNAGMQNVRADLQQVADEAAMADYQARHGNENQNENENDNENVEQPGAATPMVEGAPVEFTPGMEITVIDDDGNEQAATVLGRVRSENFQYVPDVEGNIIEYKVDGQVKHDNIDQLAQRVVSHVEPVEQPTEEAAMPTEEVQQPTIAQQPSTAIAEEE